ncbi:MAG: twin-arginine translocase subunit TatC [Proteobacteria bacterium]|nr:twin-arginine translocase subunit TatC [Pseudomonadota bacterium]MBU1737736.1 twin-arginine translocase subunit TatC [Pseudomonadota bacterium]
MADENPIAGFFGEHFKELRQRVIVSFVAVMIFTGVAYLFAEQISFFLMKPIFAAEPSLSGLVYTNLTEAFVSYLKISVLAGLGAGFPVFCYELWMFVGPGLKRHEKRLALTVTFWATILFGAGVLFAYFIALPRILSFFMSFSGEQLSAMPRLDAYLTFVARTSLAFGLAFEIPFLMMAAGRTGILDRGYFIEKRWLSYLGILVLSFLLTAGDFLGAFLLALPLFVLYESGIILLFIFSGKKKVKEAPESKDLAG